MSDQDPKDETQPTTPVPAAPTSLVKRSAKSTLLKLINDPDDDYNRWMSSLPDQISTRIKKQQARMTTGLYASAILLCPGYLSCKFQSQCPIPIRHPDGTIDPGKPENYPLGQGCVVEQEYYQQQLLDYYDELDINLDSALERVAAQELAAIDVLIRRADKVIGAGDSGSQGQDFLHVDESISDRDGSMVGQRIGTSTKMHPAVEVRERLAKRRSAVRKEFMATRADQAAYALKVGAENRKASESQRAIEIVEAAVKRLSKEMNTIDIEAVSEATKSALKLK